MQTRKISGKMYAKRVKVKEPTKNKIFFFGSMNNNNNNKNNNNYCTKCPQIQWLLLKCRIGTKD